MNLTASRKITRFSIELFESLRARTEGVYTLIILAALAAFEIFNYSTTDFALRDMLGNQGIGALSWSTILSLAFCAMDFAGIARLLAEGPHQEEEDGRGGWYLLGAWVLAAAMNAGLTWWGVSVAVYNHPVENALIIDPLTFVTAVPVLVAVMVWVIRILIIGALVTSLDKAIPAGRKEKSAVKKNPFGYRADGEKIPAGYQPMPNTARAQKRANLR